MTLYLTSFSFLVNMIYAFQDYENLYLVMDLLTGGDLRYHISRKRRFNEQQTSILHLLIIFLEFFIGCVLLGLDYIHKNSIIHRDIKPENLVCDENGYIRITDFGVAKVNHPDNSSETSGTPGYMAPEVLCAQNHSYPVDYFAIGVMGYEFMLGQRPYLGRSRKEIKQVVLRKQVQIEENEIADGWSKESADFINRLLQRKEMKRLGYKGGVKELKAHPWFNGFDWDKLYNKTMLSPFMPKTEGNYDKKYCEAIEKLSADTIARYQSYMKRDDFTTLFANYTYSNTLNLNETQESIKLSKVSSTRATKPSITKASTNTNSTINNNFNEIRTSNVNNQESNDSNMKQITKLKISKIGSFTRVKDKSNTGKHIYLRENRNQDNTNISNSRSINVYASHNNEDDLEEVTAVVGIKKHTYQPKKLENSQSCKLINFPLIQTKGIKLKEKSFLPLINIDHNIRGNRNNFYKLNNRRIGSLVRNKISSSSSYNPILNGTKGFFMKRSDSTGQFSTPFIKVKEKIN